MDFCPPDVNEIRGVDCIPVPTGNAPICNFKRFFYDSTLTTYSTGIHYQSTPAVSIMSMIFYIASIIRLLIIIEKGTKLHICWYGSYS